MRTPGGTAHTGPGRIGQQLPCSQGNGDTQFGHNFMYAGVGEEG